MSALVRVIARISCTSCWKEELACTQGCPPPIPAHRNQGSAPSLIWALKWAQEVQFRVHTYVCMCMYGVCMYVYTCDDIVQAHEHSECMDVYVHVYT